MESHNTRSVKFTNTETVTKIDTPGTCPTCGGVARKGGKYCGHACWVAARRSGSIVDRFWEKVEKTPHCWLWKAGTFANGYGQFGLNADGKTIPTQAHRVAWEFTNGPLPKGVQICHSCDNRLCVRPDHLFPGTQLDNMRDAAVKGRLHSARPGKHKVKTEQLPEVEAMLAAGYPQQHIADKFGVSRHWVTMFATGKTRQYDRPRLKSNKGAA